MKSNKIFENKFYIQDREFGITIYGAPTYSFWDKMKKVWNSKGKILEGILNNWFPDDFIKRIVKGRLEICRSNKCNFYDENGIMENSIVKGFESCGNCGCVLKYKTASLSSSCPMSDLGHKGYWEAVMTEWEEDEFRNKTGLKNE